MSSFDDSHSDFYDLEYFLSLEWRYLSGAHRSRVEHILSAVGDVTGKRCLDVGCGGGFMARELQKRGAHVSGIDYARSAVQFAAERFPGLDIRQGTGYDLSVFADGECDVVLLLDVIEHMGDQSLVLSNIRRVLKPGGKLIISTDVEGGIWSMGKIPSLIRYSEYLSSDGRAYRLIKKVEAARRAYKDYHQSHVAALGADDIEQLLSKEGYSIEKHVVYPLVGVPVRDFFLSFLPKRFRGDHQTLVAIRS